MQTTPLIPGQGDLGIFTKVTDILRRATAGFDVLSNWTRKCSLFNVPSDIYNQLSAFLALHTFSKSSHTYGTTLFPITYELRVELDYERRSNPTIEFSFKMEPEIELPFTPQNITTVLGSAYSVSAMEGTRDHRRSLNLEPSLVAKICSDVTFFYKTSDDHGMEEEISARELVVYIRQPRYDLYLNIDHIAKYLATFHIQAFGSGIRLVVDSLRNQDTWSPVSYGYKMNSNCAMWCFPLKENPRVVLVYQVAVGTQKDVPIWTSVCSKFVWTLRQNKSQRLSADFMVEAPARFMEILRRHPVEMGERNHIGYIVLYVPLDWFEKKKTIENLLLLPNTLNVGVTDIKRMQHERMRRFHRTKVAELEQIREVKVESKKKIMRKKENNPYEDMRHGRMYSW